MRHRRAGVGQPTRIPSPIAVGRETGFDSRSNGKEIAVTVLERAAQEVADAAAHPPFLFQLPLEEGRAIFHEAQSGDVAKPDADVNDIDVVVGPLGRVPVRLRP
jgi:hypothetical protein